MILLVSILNQNRIKWIFLIRKLCNIHRFQHVFCVFCRIPDIYAGDYSLEHSMSNIFHVFSFRQANIRPHKTRIFSQNGRYCRSLITASPSLILNNSGIFPKEG